MQILLCCLTATTFLMVMHTFADDIDQSMEYVIDSPAINYKRAHNNYMLKCQGCHGAHGSGVINSVPSMHNFVGKFLTVEGGREFLVRVPGSANSTLSDAALAELLNWILVTMSAEQLPHDFKPYTVAEVTAVRYQKLLDVAPIRAALVAKFDSP